eukprot:gnl/MRDRNA2_/MRDRNA2_35128_c0_seq1.p1 gnl/MRDRNA2_/MRDRNA2_35128_c0~~gnl/MRDRNA2_/MRDRNA2_35128_c0_seq1.p1  ORF type:complete len:225 (-),score=49.62 gnl/MRDRNA2_/MRDRNA2_35128_c0_seq1:18-692(-)
MCTGINPTAASEDQGSYFMFMYSLVSYWLGGEKEKEEEKPTRIRARTNRVVVASSALGVAMPEANYMEDQQVDAEKKAACIARNRRALESMTFLSAPAHSGCFSFVRSLIPVPISPLPDPEYVIAKDKQLKQKLKEKGYRKRGRVIRYLAEGESKQVKVEWRKKEGGVPLCQVVERRNVQRVAETSIFTHYRRGQAHSDDIQRGIQDLYKRLEKMREKEAEAEA